MGKSVVFGGLEVFCGAGFGNGVRQLFLLTFTYIKNTCMGTDSINCKDKQFSGN